MTAGVTGTTFLHQAVACGNELHPGVEFKGFSLGLEDMLDLIGSYLSYFFNCHMLLFDWLIIHQWRRAHMIHALNWLKFKLLLEPKFHWLNLVVWRQASWW